jgi:trehalose synthase
MDAIPTTLSMKPQLTTIYDYAPLVGSEAVERIAKSAEELRDRHIVHVSSTYYGGGVAELLSSLTLLINASGIRTGWRVIQGRPDFFSVTKKMHNALQGGEINLTEQKKEIYEEVVFENAMRMHLDHDLVIVHDPQPLPLIRHFRKKAPWIWRCHVDLSCPNPDLWAYLAPFIESYDAVVLSMPEYAQKLNVPQRFIMPAIVAGRDRRAAQALRNSDRPAARGANLPVRQMEGSARRSRSIPDCTKTG